jgi:hypothetical protein
MAQPEKWVFKRREMLRLPKNFLQKFAFIRMNENPCAVMSILDTIYHSGGLVLSRT